MIHVERTSDGRLGVGMSGSMEDLLVETTVVISHILGNVPDEHWGALMAEISANALIFARKDKEEGITGRSTTIANTDVLEDAIKKTTGGEN